VTDHPTDDFDELLRAAARDYNRPGDAPRDRMWEEIRARRARGAATSVTPFAPHRSRRRVWLISAAAAAVLIIGIAIGRVSDSWMVLPGTGAHVSVGRDSAGRDSAMVVASRRPVIDSTTHADSGPRDMQPIPRSTREPTPRSTQTAPRSTPTGSQPYDGSANMAYRLAMVEHLAGTEAMLTSFRAAAKHGDVDAQITTWARNLLTTTRLLQASAGQDDPTMKRLLDDLELVLVQIAQYTNAGPHRVEELELIEHSIERRGVIGKLHTNIPARFAPAGT
jgi:hypothetical protein